MRSFFSLLALAAPLATAHFTLDFPLSRGFDEDIEPMFCGGFPNVALPRQVFPLGSAPILIGSHHPSASVAILISFDANPTTFANFNQTSSGVAVPLLKNFGTINGLGEYCFNVDIASLGVAGVKNGSLATIQVEFNGGDGVLFQCSDVILSSSYTASNVTCANSTTFSVTPGAAAASSAIVSSTPVSAASASVASATASVAKSAALGRTEMGAGAVILGAIAASLSLL